MPAEHSPLHKEALDQFVLLWGEMASAWGINKTMAQIHALLYVEANPLDTDAIMSQLDISRGNANMNLRNLLKWQLIHKVHFKGSRKDYYTAEKEVWSIVSTIIRERQQREIEPIHQNLDKCLQLFEQKDELTEEEAAFRERIDNFTEFLAMFDRFTEALLPYINKRNLKFIKQLVKIAEMKHSIIGDQPASKTDSTTHEQ